MVDPDLQITEVTPTFGQFIKYYMRDQSASESGVTTVTTTVIQSIGQCRNAFQIMMAAQAELCSKQLPDARPDVNPNPRNGKEKLRNDVLLFLAAKGCKWKNSSELDCLTLVVPC